METMNNQRLNELEEKGLFNLTDEEILEYGKLIKDTNQLDKDWDIHHHSSGPPSYAREYCLHLIERGTVLFQAILHL